VTLSNPRPDPHTASTDADLVFHARSGSVDALAQLYQRYVRVCLRTALGILGETTAAEDVTHDLFVGLPEALRRYEEQGKLESWLRRVTARLALSRLRRDQSTREASLDDSAIIDDRSNDPHTRLTLEAAVLALPSSLRAVLVLKEIEGFSHAEIAQSLGISKGASEVRLHRALAQLRGILNAGEDR
jgi:RNA polymerase sigma-70 factor (ECF subfamily)